MDLRDGIGLALRQIRTQRLKSIFAVLGVVVGIMFLMTVVSLIEGMSRYVEEDFAQLIYGLNTITVSRIPEISFDDAETWREWQRRPLLRFEDAEAIRERLGGAALVAVESHSGGRLEAEDGTEVENVWLTAASADYFRIREFQLGRGRVFSGPEDRLGVPVVVLGYESADLLFGSLDPVGRTVQIDGFPYRVVGVLEQQGSLFGESLDNRAIAPARSPLAGVLNPRGVVDNILIRTPDEQAMARAMVEAEAIMRARHGLRPTEANDFAVQTVEDAMELWAEISQVLYTAFPSLVGVALVAGVIVIMNIMLVSVLERTREIGMRKAIGARRRDIIVQVLIESATLAGAGAALGIVIGAALAEIVRAVSPLPAAIALHWVAVFVILGAGIGVLAGLYPAARAARMDPVVAIRAE